MQNFGSPTSTTANETAESVKTKYESNSDTNAFTDDDKQKLDGIEIAADISSFTTAFHAAANAAQPTQEES